MLNALPNTAKATLKGKSLISWKYQQYMRDYLATVLSVDENIGRLAELS